MRIIGFDKEDCYIEISNNGLPKLVLDCEYKMFEEMINGDDILNHEIDELVIKKGVLVGMRIGKYYGYMDE